MFVSIWPAVRVHTTALPIDIASRIVVMPAWKSTSTSGIFVSRDAPYGTIFSAFVVNQAVNAIGGLVDGNATIVILQLDEPIGG